MFSRFQSSLTLVEQEHVEHLAHVCGGSWESRQSRDDLRPDDETGMRVTKWVFDAYTFPTSFHALDFCRRVNRVLRGRARAEKQAGPQNRVRVWSAK